MFVGSSVTTKLGGRPLIRVIFDSSFLMAVVEAPTTWFEDITDNVGGFQPALPDCVRGELDRVARGKGRKSRLARVSLDLASSFKVLHCGKAQVDDEIISAALTENAMVATNDVNLARLARAAHLRVISIRRGRVFVD